MSTARQAIASRRKARMDKRYSGWRKDAAKRTAKMRAQVEREKQIKQGKKK